ncbi:MAG TPA: TraR/DksA family transcriptional regulator [Burkholderiales bacterium]|nr:TraR/DksA family transcriptional regulator [Burkholderiales bacterium]
MALTSQQSEELKDLIDKRRSALVAEIRQDVARARNEPFGEIAGSAPDAGDESVAVLIQDLDQFDVSRDLAELRELEAARERIASGQYGTCSECGSEIEYARLKANPGAARCLHCQQVFEKTHAGAGRPTL